MNGMIYELPHELDRKGQQEAFEYIMNSPDRFVFVQAPTGSGKSAWAAAASLEQRTLVLVHTKSLQSSNYLDSYKFNILYGKGNYDCMDMVNRKLGYKTDDCDIRKNEYTAGMGQGELAQAYAESGARYINFSHCQCPYYQAYEQCLESYRVCFNYAKYLRTLQFTLSYSPQFMFLDECHQLPNLITDYVGTTIRWDNEFIQWRDSIPININDGEEAYILLSKIYQRIQSNEPKKSTQLKEHRKWRYLIQKISTTMNMLNGSDWYFGSDEEKLVIKPLTAKYHFGEFFNRANKVVLMSATLNADLLASELGIDEYDSYVVPNVYPAPMRRIWDLDVPKLNWRSTDIEKQAHAQGIAQAIRNQPSSWSGIIHTTSKYGADELSSRLEGLGINTFVPPKDSGTEVQLKEWYANRKPGTMCVAWAFHEGVDLGEDQICIIAKTPYASIKEGYERARVDYNKQLYKLQTAWKLEQSAGRVRRGRIEHYVPSQKFVAIADRSWRGVRSLLSKDFKDAIKVL